MLNRSGAMDIHDALQREDSDAAVQLSMNDCGVSGKMSFEFDPSEPAGEYTLNLGSEYDLKILFSLVKISVEGRGDFQKGSMQLDGRSVSLSAAELQRHFEAWIVEETPGGGSRLLPEKGELKCRFLSNMGMPSDGEELAEAKMLRARALVVMPGTDFEFAASFAHLLKGYHLSTQQALSLLRLIAPSESTRRALCVEACINRLSNPQQQHLLLQELSDLEHDLVLKRLGLRAFEYTPGILASPSRLGRLHCFRSTASATSTASPPPSHYLPSHSIRTPLFLSSDGGTTTSICPWPLPRAPRPRGRCTPPRCRAHRARHWCTGNPTGFHRLDLSKEPEREVALHLIRFKNSQMLAEEAAWQASKDRVGGVRPKFDRVWRNALLNREPMTYHPTFVLPKQGILSLDFVQITKVPAETEAVANLELHLRLEEGWWVELAFTAPPPPPPTAPSRS
jgi:hypothetical protein